MIPLKWIESSKSSIIRHFTPKMEAVNALCAHCNAVINGKSHPLPERKKVNYKTKRMIAGLDVAKGAKVVKKAKKIRIERLGPRNVDVRRDILAFVKVISRFCNLGHMRGEGMHLGDRARIAHQLRLIFGDTFVPGAYFYDHPHVELFLTALLHVASCGRIAMPAFGVEPSPTYLFAQAVNGNYYVDTTQLNRLGCTRAELITVFKSTYVTDSYLRSEIVAPLLIPAPA